MILVIGESARSLLDATHDMPAEIVDVRVLDNGWIVNFDGETLPSGFVGQFLRRGFVVSEQTQSSKKGRRVEIKSGRGESR